MLIDSHCHLASHKFEPSEREGIVHRASLAGVKKIVSLATCLEDIADNLTIADIFPGVGICVGIHPCDVHNAPDNAVEVIKPFANDRRVVGIGETGLDYYHPAPEGWSEEDFRQRQKNFLQQHFLLAARSGLGVVIHTRDRSGCQSFDDAREIYQRHADKVRALFHCFIGSRENAEKVISLGGLVSFGGVTTFKSARDVLAVASGLPLGTFLLETDSPYLAPVPHRGQRNEPAYVAHTCACIAAARGESFDDLAAHTGQAALEFFPRLAEL